MERHLVHHRASWDPLIRQPLREETEAIPWPRMEEIRRRPFSYLLRWLDSVETTILGVTGRIYPIEINATWEDKTKIRLRGSRRD